MTQPQAELVLDLKATLGEGPCWDHRSGLLYWLDIEGKQVHIYDPKTGRDRAVKLSGRPGAAVPRQSGGLVVAMEHAFCLLDLETERVTPLNELEAGLRDNRFNDGKCDEAGRFWAGTMNTAGDAATGSLYCLEADRTVRRTLGDLTNSNGIGWSPDGRTMYHIDTPTRRVTAYDFDAESGRLGASRIAAAIAEGDGFPDGMTVDAEGMLWVAHWGGGQVSRWNPQTGEQLETIALPADCVSACTFGGPDLDELYITTARSGQSAEALARQPHAGGLFRVKPGVAGRPAHFYAG